MKKLIIIGAVLASAALIVLLAHEGALTEESTKKPTEKRVSSTQMIIKMVTKDGSFIVKDELGRTPEPIERDTLMDNLKRKNIKVEQIGEVYKYEENPHCTVYCAGGNCWQFCW